MSDLLKFNAKICYTAAGILIHENKVLLIKHKKLGFWLPPGGHIDKNELPHHTAEREFWEETSIRTKTKKTGFIVDDERTQFFPTPINVNLHWISKENYLFRTKNKKLSEKTKKNWSKGCEQHYNMLFLLEPTDGVEYKQNVEETDGIAFFSQSELDDIEIPEHIKKEINFAFKNI
ncbi:MAG: NUDIX domain-containing protein [Patescibacteria group bacterium]